MKKKTKIYAGIGGGLAALMIIGMAASPSDTEDVPAADASAVIVDQAAPVEVVEASEAAPEAPALSLAQQQAVYSAELYLDGDFGWSHAGLIGQLEYEGFSTEDATLAVDSLGLDWNEQAVFAAQSYLDTDLGFSRDGMLDQLTIAGEFTPEQATHAVDTIGL